MQEDDELKSPLLNCVTLQAASLLLVVMAGCARTLKTDEYVPFILDTLEARGVFDDPVAVVDESLALGQLPRSWRIDPSDRVHFVSPGSIVISPYPWSRPVFPHSERQYVGSARIAAIIEKDDAYLEILISAVIPTYPFPEPRGAALVHARTRDDARVVAHGYDAHNLMETSIRATHEARYRSEGERR